MSIDYSNEDESFEQEASVSRLALAALSIPTMEMILGYLQRTIDTDRLSEHDIQKLCSG